MGDDALVRKIEGFEGSFSDEVTVQLREESMDWCGVSLTSSPESSKSFIPVSLFLVSMWEGT